MARTAGPPPSPPSPRATVDYYPELSHAVSGCIRVRRACDRWARLNSSEADARAGAVLIASIKPHHVSLLAVASSASFCQSSLPPRYL
jgi:hypothetical protein